MASDFLTGLANSIGDQFGLGENNNHSLDLATNGTVQKYGKLGDFAKRFDQSQERRYVQEGYLRTDPYNVSVKQLEILMQEPDITLLVKKRAFASLSENFRLDHLDTDEKLFYKATKILFQNKAQQIAAVERLSKIARVTTESGEIAKQLFPLVLSLVDEIGNGITTSTEADILNGTFTSGFGKLQSVVNQVRKVYNYTGNAAYTTWLSDTTNPFKTTLGQGSGVIEFTNVTSINTNCNLSTNPAGANFTISDPYNLMRITETDIERALSDATNQVYNHKIFQFGEQSSDDIATALIKQLNAKRLLRGAGNIEFVINADTVLGKKVRAIIERSGLEVNFTYSAAVGLGSLAGGGVTVSIESYRGGLDVGDEGLDPAGGGNSEIELFGRAVENLFNGLALKQNAQSITAKNSTITNYARRKLRSHYLGKLMVQSMDQVSVYISSKAKLDTKVMGGLQNMFSGLGFLQNLNNGAADIKNQFESLFNPAANTNLQLEKSVIVGSDFPNWLWSILRSQFVNDTGGAHVYAGLVGEPAGSYNSSSGSYSVSFSAESNLKFLDLGKVNFKPSLDVFNGPFYDPLTPFKTNTDTISGSFKKDTPVLLDENKELLSYGVVKFKSGPNVGQVVTEEKLLNSNDKETESLGQTRNIYYAPDGFTYRWKEGIGTLVQFSEAGGLQNSNSTGSPSLTVEPFAGQDVMNVISLAITGIPYNYATFVKAARKANGYSRDVQSGSDSAHSFYRSLTNNLSKNNSLWGNFIPFKNLVMDEASFEKVLTAQTTITNVNDQITTKLQTVRDLTEKLQHLQGINKAGDSKSVIENRLVTALKKQQEDLNSLYDQVSNQLERSSNQSLSIAGDDVSYDFDEFINNDTKNSESLTNPNVRRDVRRKTNFLTRKLSWQVRANEDKNFLIIDDSYDKDYDLMAFEQDLSGKMEAFNSDYQNVKDKVSQAAQLLDLEVYCDTQGHIRVRPPQYNRMPSSIFYKLFRLKQQTGIQIFPQFLEDLFVNQIQTLVKNLSIIEDQIRLDAAALGKNTDEDVYALIRGSSAGAKFSDAKFSFVTDEATGEVTNFQNIFTTSNPDQLIAQNSQSFIDQLTAQAGSKKAFNTVVRAKFLTALNNPIPATVTNSNRVNQLLGHLKSKTGQQPSLDNFLIKSFDGTVTSAATSPKNQVDAFKVTTDIANKISQRQKLIKLAANALKNAKEYLSLDNDKSTTNKLLFPDLTQNSNIPEVFASMIEDETYDDFGPGSGSRYVIKDYQITAYTIREQAPEYTTVEVKGQLDPFLTNNQLPSELNNSLTGGGAGGNALVSAAAIDYDLWKMYGIKNPKAFSAPFLSKPETQCAPYAAMLLSRMRKNILQGSVTIAGNEYMQPGDVVYLESVSLLFYVQQVSHNFSYGSKFETVLTLTHGHPAGDYIPTTLDLIGKLIYNNRDSTHFVNYRQNSTNNEQHVGTIVLDSRSSSDSDIESDMLLGGNFGSQNIATITNIKNICQEALLVNQDPNSSMSAQIELRIFGDGSFNNTLHSAATIVNDLLTNFNLPNNKSPLVNLDTKFNYQDVTVYQVDISGKKEYRSPSQQAVDMVRNIQDLTSSNSFTSVLYGYIIDCWITFSNKSSTTTG